MKTFGRVERVTHENHHPMQIWSGQESAFAKIISMVKLIEKHIAHGIALDVRLSGSPPGCGDAGMYPIRHPVGHTPGGTNLVGGIRSQLSAYGAI